MRKWLMPCVALLLQGCQPPPPFVIAVIETGKLTFHIRQRGLFADRIFGWDDSHATVRRLTIVNGNLPIVRFEQWQGAMQPCLSSDKFPVTLGERRCGYRWVGRNILPTGEQIYSVYLDSCVGVVVPRCNIGGEYWADRPVGRFRLNPDGSVANIRPD